MISKKEAGRRARRIPFGSTLPDEVRVALQVKAERQAFRATMDQEQKRDRKRELQVQSGVVRP